MFHLKVKCPNYSLLKHCCQILINNFSCQKEESKTGKLNTLFLKDSKIN